MATPAPAKEALLGETSLARNFIVTEPGSAFQYFPANNELVTSKYI